MTKKKDDSDDGDLFQRLMSGVTPLETEPRIAPRKAYVSPHPKPRDAAQHPATHFVERQNAELIGAEESLNFNRASLQRRRLQRLRRGEIPHEARLDLHGHTIAEAGAALSRFLQDVQQSGRRCVLVVHGKGRRSGTGQPVLKSQLNRWLRDEPSVLAFQSAQPSDGGTGALYVLLRRESEQK